MCFTAKTDGDGTLLDGFGCVFYLEDAALWGAMIIVSWSSVGEVRVRTK